jgi:hypothetical protein
MEIREIVRKRLHPFMQDFANRNSGNRLSNELLIGMGGMFEDFIVTMCNEIENTATEGKKNG